MQKHFLIRSLILSALLFCSSNCYAGLARYYSLIIAAENELCAGRTEAAFAQYKKVYNIVRSDMPSMVMYNFFAVSIDVHEYGTSQKLLTELIGRGWTFDNYHSFLGKFYSGRQLDSLDELYRTSSKNAKSTIDLALTKSVDSLEEVDQRVDKYTYTFPDESIELQQARDSFEKVTRWNLKKLHSLFKDDFPSDRKLGRKHGQYSGATYDIILVHSGALDGAPEHVLNQSMYRAVLSGKLSPTDFESYVTFRYQEHGTDSVLKIDDLEIRVPMNPYSFVLTHDSLFLIPVRSTRVDSCDAERRKVLGLCSSEELKSRIIFQHYHPKYIMLTYMNSITQVDFELPMRIRKELVYVPKEDFAL